MRINRRQLLTRVLTLSLAGLLSACRGAERGSPTAALVPTPTGVVPPAPTPSPSLSPTIHASPTPSAVGLMRPPEPNPKRGGILRTAGGIPFTQHNDLHQGAWWDPLCYLYNNLVRKNLADGLRTIAPDLAERWEITSDGKQYTFYLRRGVKFHDGTLFSADDVVATFTRIISPPDGIAITLKGLFAAIDKVDKIDDYTVQFTLARPQPWLLDSLTYPQVVIYSKKTLEENNYDLRQVIAPGTGAFRHKERVEGEKWVFERNPDYWDPELPYIDGIEALNVPEWTDRGTAVITGRADYSQNTSVEMLHEAEKHSDIVTARQIPSLGGVYLVYFNCSRPPLSDSRVRRAIHLGVSRQALLSAFGSFEGVKFSRWLPRYSRYATPEDELARLPGYRADKSQDLEEAKRLLSEAGFASGLGPLDLLVASLASHSQILAPAVQDQLRAVGIQTNIRIMERFLLNEEISKGAFDLVIVGTDLTTTGDPSQVWNTSLRSNGSENYARYSNRDFDSLLDQIDVELDEAQRRELVARAQDILDNDPPWLVIGWVDHNPIWRNYVKGLALDQRVLSDFGRIETVWLDR